MASVRPRSVQRAVIARDGARCVMCGSADRLSVHHIRPRSLGGRSRPANLVTMCWPCHSFLHFTTDRLSAVLLYGAGAVLVWVARRGWRA